LVIEIKKCKNKIKTYVDGVEMPRHFSLTPYIRGIFRKLSKKIFYIINKKECDTIFQYLNIEPNDDILDIGFEYCYYHLSKKLSKQNTNFPFSYGALKILKNGKLRFILPGENRSAFEDNRFTKIYTLKTIFFMNEYDKVFHDIKRILKPNGIFINIISKNEYFNKIIYKRYGYKEYDVEEIKEITERYGMKIIKTVEIRKDKTYCIISENIK
jgi:SAM-dependent methyltransferase